MSSHLLAGGDLSSVIPSNHDFGKLPQPGSPAFLTTLLRELQDDPTHGFHFDTTIFVGVFMCLIAKGANLIIDVDDDAVLGDDDDDETSLEDAEERGLQRVMRMTELIVSNVFGRKSLCSRVKPFRNADEAVVELLGGQHSASARSREPSRRPSVASSSHIRNKSRETSGSRLASSAHSEQQAPHAQTASVDPSRLPEVLILRDLDHSNRQTQLTICEMLRSRKLHLPRRSIARGKEVEGLPMSSRAGDVHLDVPDATQPLPSPSRSHRNGKERRDDEQAFGLDHDDERIELDLPDDFLCIWIRSTTLTEKPPLPAWLIDRFTFKCRASRGANDDDLVVPPMRLHAAVPSEYLATLRSLANKTHMHPPLRAHISNVFSALHGHPRLHANITSSSITSFKSFIRIARVLFRPFDWSPATITADPHGIKEGRAYDQRRKLVERSDWFATDDDIREVFGNLVEFRVSLRQAREEVMWPLKGGADGIELELSAGNQSRVKPRDPDQARYDRDQDQQVQVQLILRRILDIV